MSEQIENIKNELVEKSAAKAIESANAAVETKTAEINENLNTKLDGFAKSEDLSKVAKSVDEIKEMQKSFGIKKSRSPKVEMLDFAKSELTKLREKGDESGSFTLNTKDFTVAAGSDSYQAYGEDDQSMIQYDPNHQTRLRNFVSTFSAGSGSVRWNQESALTDNTGTKVKGAAITSNVQTLQPVISPIQTIMSALTIPEEHLSDITGIDAYLNGRLMGLLMDEEDDQILAGNGTSPNLEGINVVAPAANRLTTATLADTFFGAAFDSAIDSANNYDVLNSVSGELEASNFRPSTCILNPADLRALGLIKSTQGEYVLTQAVEQGAIVWYYMGLRLVPNAAQSQGTFTVFDPSTIGYFMNGGIEYKFGYNTDDFLSNNITVRAIQRGALAGFRPNGVVTGTFSIAAASLETP